LFAGDSEDELHAVLETWWSAETQNTLHGLVSKLGKKVP